MTPEETKPAEVSPVPATSDALIELKGVSHWYRGSGMPAVDAVDLRVGEGEIVALVGESGCGKSTLGRVMCGSVQPAEGDVQFRGQSIAGMSGGRLKTFRRQAQMVHQDPFASLNPGLTLRTILGSAVRYHKVVSRRGADDFVVDMLRRVGLDASREFLDRYPHQLSGGQRQRVAIARAFSLNPSLIVADEAVSMLDVSMRVSLLDLMLSFHQDHGMAYVFISHDLGVVRYFAGEGRIVVMFFGVVVEEGLTEEVISVPSHPYTASLLESLPVPDPRRARARREREQLMDLKASALEADGVIKESGCVFRHRCPLAQDRCEQAPPLLTVGGTHRSACWFHEEVTEKSASVVASRQGVDDRR